MPFFGDQMIEGLIAGTLMGDPEARIGKGDSRFVLAKVRAQNNDGEFVIVNVIAFDPVASKVLAALREGDAVSVAGSINPKVWADRQGVVRPALDVVAHKVIGCPEGEPD
jgi:single-stranded DNA-binding protein